MIKSSLNQHLSNQYFSSFELKTVLHSMNLNRNHHTKALRHFKRLVKINLTDFLTTASKRCTAHSLSSWSAWSWTTLPIFALNRRGNLSLLLLSILKYAYHSLVCFKAVPLCRHSPKKLQNFPISTVYNIPIPQKNTRLISATKYFLM